MKATLVEDCRGVLQVYSDGTIVRSNKAALTVPIVDDGRVITKDIIYNEVLELELRLYLPSHCTTNLPIFLNFHGGGFCIGFRTNPNFDYSCHRLADALNALVISPDYRLAPEHRLPAAIDDGYCVLEWIRSQALGDKADPWMTNHADFSRVYVSGESAGGTIAHHLGMRAQSKDWSPMKIKGIIVLMAFFGGEEHSPSEATCPKDAFLNLELNDRYWRLSLPIGANRDHPICNPFSPEAPRLKDAVLPPVLVIAGGRDLLRDREIEYAQALKKYGKQVELIVFEEEQHCFFTLTPHSQASQQLMQHIIRFLLEQISCPYGKEGTCDSCNFSTCV
eukprot:Gb_19420 [translate_table: standard]